MKQLDAKILGQVVTVRKPYLNESHAGMNYEADDKSRIYFPFSIRQYKILPLGGKKIIRTI